MKQPPHNACSIADATVTVNSLPTDRFGPWWRHAFEADNASSAAYTQAVVTAVYSNLYSSATGHVFVAGTPEAYAYDHDGNLTQDGRFDYAWDAENRLASATTRDDLPAGVPRVRVTHRYDHRSRRIATERETWGGSAWQPAGTNRYLYDGWNVVAETRSASPANTNLYVWGLDLSGTLQGAGGIGGLLTVRKRLEDGTGIVRNYDYLFDANGNVVQEILRTDGAINAHYEYDPFGTAVIALRVDATDNPFRFSTKWFDNDTGLGYWGYRWYSPSTGRWLSRDPIEHLGDVPHPIVLAESCNLYCYCRNALSVDVYGLLEWRYAFEFGCNSSWVDSLTVIQTPNPNPTRKIGLGSSFVFSHVCVNMGPFQLCNTPTWGRIQVRDRCCREIRVRCTWAYVGLVSTGGGKVAPSAAGGVSNGVHTQFGSKSITQNIKPGDDRTTLVWNTETQLEGVMKIARTWTKVADVHFTSYVQGGIGATLAEEFSIACNGTCVD